MLRWQLGHCWLWSPQEAKPSKEIGCAKPVYSPLHCLLCWPGSKLVFLIRCCIFNKRLDLWVNEATLKAVLYWSFKPKMSAKHSHPYTYFPLQTNDISLGTWNYAKPGSLCQYQAIWPLPGSQLPLNTTQPPKRMHPIYLCLSTSRHKAPCRAVLLFIFFPLSENWSYFEWVLPRPVIPLTWIQVSLVSNILQAKMLRT